MFILRVVTLNLSKRIVRAFARPFDSLPAGRAQGDNTLIVLQLCKYFLVEK